MARHLPLVNDRTTRVNSFALSPRYLQILASSGIKPKETHRLSSLSTIYSAAAPLKAGLYEYIRDCIGQNIFVSNCSGMLASPAYK